MSKTNKNNSVMWRLVCAGLCALMLSACASTSTQTLRGPEELFPTPEQAVAAYADATRNNNKPELLKILGPDAANLISSGDPVADKKWRARFLAAYDTARKLESEGDDKDVLVVGNEEWPMPIPLVHVDGGWQFDTAAGADEILNRRIGRDELNVIEVCRAYVEAQRDYYANAHEYAQKFISSDGKHDGLYWPAAENEPESPLGPLIADARAEGYAKAGTHAHHAAFKGYYYKILKQQGPDASGGAKPYIVHGHMTGGFALLAFPAKYGSSGIMSFIVNQNGIVYEKNLGPDTRTIIAEITAYNPDESWKMEGE